MNFERGLNVKEAVNIGQVALAPDIQAFSLLDPSNMVEGPDGKLAPSRTNLTEQATIKALELIKEGKSERKLRFYGFIDEKEKFHRLSEYKGLYVKFKGVNYKIPE